MFHVCRWIRNLSCVGCFYGALLGSFLPARAQLIPDKGVTVQHLQEPKEGFSYCFWLNDHELVYVRRPTGSDEQYCKLDLTTGKEQALGHFTEIVKGTVYNWPLPYVFPSPDRKYVAWVGTSSSNTSSAYDDTLVVATIDGAIISHQPNKAKVSYPAWSADSKWCFGFLNGQVPDENFPGFFRSVFNAISAVSIMTPAVVKTYPITIKPEGTPNALSGYDNAAFHMGAPALLPAFRFGSENNILLVSPTFDQMPGDIQFDEYNIADTTMPVSTHTLHLPAFGEFVSAVLAPKGDAIVWKFHTKDEELWISDKDGGHMERIGKFPHEHRSRDLEYMQWLPSGKGISFLEEGGLCVVYFDAHKDAK